MKKPTKTLYICPECGSDNVEYRTWFNPNTEMSSIPYEPENQDCWCNDCETHNVLITKQFPNNGTKVIGFQVIDKKNDPHPNMDGTFCLYSLTQANDMLMDNPKEKWKLKAIYTGEIEKPVKKFGGINPRI